MAASLALLLAALLLLTPVIALAHLHLRKAEPASGATLTTAPREIRLTFTEAAQLPLSAIELTGPDGSAVTLGTLRLDSASSAVLVAPITGRLTAGTYTVAWRTASADGHPVRGRYTFTIAAGAAGLTAMEAPADTLGTAPAAPESIQAVQGAPAQASAFDADSPLYASIRWLGFVAALALIGTVTFALFVVPRAARLAKGRMEFAERAERRAAGVGLGAAVLLAIAALLRLGAQSYAVYGAGEAWRGASLSALVLHTVWGWGWLLQGIAAIVALFGLSAARRGRRGGWLVAILAALALAVAFALSGHAVATPHLAALAVLSDTLHVLGAGGWLGTLLAVVFVGIPVALQEADGARGRAVADFVNVFSPVALACAGLLVLTGVLAAWLHLGALSALWQSEYGRILLLKVAVIAILVALGALNWRVLRPALGDVAAARRLRGSAVAELAVAVLVLAVTAVLVATPPPAEARLQEAGARSTGVPSPHAP